MRIILILFFSFSFSFCSPIRHRSHGFKLIGRSEILISLSDKGLKDKAQISGYVYSRIDSTFLKSANILYSKNSGTSTDDNGYFIIDLSPGTYDLTCESVGHTKQTIKNLKIDYGDRVMLIFELGTDVIY